MVARTVLLAAVVAAALPADGADGAATRSRPVCGPKAARTVVATDRLRIFRRGKDDIVCSRYSSRRWRLYRRPPARCGGSRGCDGRMLLAVAGRWVVQVRQHDGRGSGDRGRLSLRAAGARRAAMTYGFDNAGTSVIAAALDRRGAVAWLEGPFPYAVAGSTYTIKRGGSCPPTTVAAAQTIDPDSLRLASGAVRWTDGDEEPSAPSCPIDGR